MIFKNLVIIFVTVVFVGHEASVATPDCRSNELRCGDGRCVPLDEGCGPPYTFIDLRKPMTKEIDHNVAAQKSCVMPPYPRNGRYNVFYGQNVHIEYTCDPGYTLVGKSSVECVNNIWQDAFPRCDMDGRGCDMNQLPRFSDKCTTMQERGYTICLRYVFTYTCWRGDYPRDCGYYVLEGTKVTVTHETEGYGSATSVTAEIFCSSDGIFLISTQCVEEIDIRLHEFENLTNSLITQKKYSDSLNTRHAKFEDMAKNFGTFHDNIIIKLDKMKYKIKECDIQLELLSALQHRKPVQACELPPNPENGQYTVRRRQGPLYRAADLFLMYECNPGFSLIGTNPSCIRGAWVDAFPRCSAACKLVKKAKFNYQCDTNVNASNDSCQEYVAVGSVVSVSRHKEANTEPATVSIACLEDGTFNITTTCVQELDQQQKDFELPMSTKIVEYEKTFAGMDSNDAKFQRLANEFHFFEEHVHASLQKMNRKAAECDIYLDLLLPD